MVKATDAQILAAAQEIDPAAFKTQREIAAAHGLDIDNPPAGVIITEPKDQPIASRQPARDAAIEKARRIAAILLA